MFIESLSFNSSPLHRLMRIPEAMGIPVSYLGKVRQKVHFILQFDLLVEERLVIILHSYQDKFLNALESAFEESDC